MTDIYIAVIVDEDNGGDFALASTSYDDLHKQVAEYIQQQPKDEEYAQLIADGEDYIDSYFRDDETSFERRIDFYEADLVSDTDKALAAFLSALYPDQIDALGMSLVDLLSALGWDEHAILIYTHTRPSQRHVGADLKITF